MIFISSSFVPFAFLFLDSSVLLEMISKIELKC